MALSVRVEVQEWKPSVVKTTFAVPSDVPLAFILTCIRSGSTLLRAILDSHPEICAPHELHLSDLRVELSSSYLKQAMHELGLDEEGLARLLRNHIYAQLLKGTGKRFLVDKSPTDLSCWAELALAWPSARFILLKRDPAAIAQSITEMGDGRTVEQVVTAVSRCVHTLEAAEVGLSAPLTVRYEELAAQPATEVARVCAHLGVAFDPAMLNYGSRASGPFVYGLGDWGDNILSGSVQPARASRVDPSRWPELAEACRRWGYPA